MEKDDLLNIKPKKNIKKPLIYGAIAFLIFIIAVIVYAIYSNTKEENVVLPPQVNTQSKQENTEFKEVPIEDNTTTLSQKLIVNDETTKKTENETKNTNKDSVNNTENKENKLQTQVNSASSKNKTKVKSNTKQNKTTKQITKIKYYIQVAALMKYKKPNKKFLNLIKKEGFNYIYYHTYIVKNNQKIPITKILVGPFENEKIARKELQKVKEKITQNAFIFKVK
jgi:DedD protein